MPDLGPYRNDPRIKVRSEKLIETTNGPEIREHAGSWRVYPHGYTEPAKVGTLLACLRYTLGAVQKVGPNGMGGWLHTDGETYLHDPATSAFKDADRIKAGDVIAWAAHPAAVVLEREHWTTDFFGRRLNGFWCRRLTDGVEGAVPYGDGGRFPVKFRD